MPENIAEYTSRLVGSYTNMDVIYTYLKSEMGLKVGLG